jgi:hypothetical protein
VKLAHVHHKSSEPVWHVQAAILIAIILQLVLSHALTVGPKYAVAAVELLLLVALIMPGKGRAAWRFKRSSALLLIAIISIANFVSLVLVVHVLFTNSHVSGRELIASGLAIYLTNIIVFGLWYWELDSSGVQGQSPAVKPVDFLFPQMTPGEHVKEPGLWSPTFFDYLYTSLTNATAFSPTDTMPLTHRAKLLMSMQSLISLITVALVAARAVSILA